MNMMMNMMLMSKNNSKNKSGELTDKYPRISALPLTDGLDPLLYAIARKKYRESGMLTCCSVYLTVH